MSGYSAIRAPASARRACAAAIDLDQVGPLRIAEAAGPLGVDFHIGLSPTEFHRISNVVPPPPLPFDFATLDWDSVLVKTFTGPAPDATTSWTPEWRQADIGAANGHGNARSVALLQALVACAGVTLRAVATSPFFSASSAI